MDDKGSARKYLDFLFDLNIGGSTAVSRPSDKGVGGGIQISLFRPSGPQFGLKVTGNQGLPSPSPGYATA